MEPNTQELATKIRQGIGAGLDQGVGGAFGIKIIVSEDVPQGEVWFFDSNNTKFVLKNIAGLDLKINGLPL